MRLLGFVPFVFLVACGGSERLYFGGAIFEPQSDGSFLIQDIAEGQVLETGGVVAAAYGYGWTDPTNIGGGGVSSNTSSSGDNGVYAVAGYLPDTDVGTVPTSGTMSQSAVYGMYVVTGTHQSASPADWEYAQVEGTMTVTVDLDDQSFDAASSDGLIAMDGYVHDGTLMGSVVYSDTSYDASGYIEGLFGTDGTVGAFDCEGNNIMCAGAFATP